MSTIRDWSPRLRAPVAEGRWHLIAQRPSPGTAAGSPSGTSVRSEARADCSGEASIQAPRPFMQAGEGNLAAQGRAPLAMLALMELVRLYRNQAHPIPS